MHVHTSSLQVAGRFYLFIPIKWVTTCCTRSPLLCLSPSCVFCHTDPTVLLELGAASATLLTPSTEWTFTFFCALPFDSCFGLAPFFKREIRGSLGVYLYLIEVCKKNFWFVRLDGHRKFNFRCTANILTIYGQLGRPLHFSLSDPFYLLKSRYADTVADVILSPHNGPGYMYSCHWPALGVKRGPCVMW